MDKTIQKRNATLANIDLDLARQQLAYNPDTGVFTWKVRSPGRTEVGQVAGGVMKGGYLKVGLQGKSVLAHLLAFMFMKDHPPIGIIDHIDGDPSNNQWSNLRETDRAGNNRNSRVRKHNALGVKGVQVHKDGRFKAKIQFDGKQHYLGLFDTVEEAGAAYAAAAAKHYGEFARTA